MADIIDRTQQIYVIIRFEMRLEELVSIHRHLIFIRIQHLCLRFLIQCFHTLIQRMCRQFVVVIGKYHKLTRCRLDRSIRIF